VLVRDPVVVTTSLPNFLAPGDQSRLQLDLTSVTDVAGTLKLSVHSTGTAVTVDPAYADRSIDIAAGERKMILVPIAGARVGDDMITASLTLPDGTVLDKSLNIGVRLNEPPVVTTDFVDLAPGTVLTV